jgi:Lon protease-like protein
LRARIVEELASGEPYRIVRAERLRDEISPPERERAAAESLRRLVLALCAAQPGATSGALAQIAARAALPGELADTLAGALLESAEERQALLEELSPERRLARLSTAVAVALAQTANVSSPRN